MPVMRFALLVGIFLSLTSLIRPVVGADPVAEPSLKPAETGQDYDYTTALKISQDAIGRRLGDYRLTDDAGGTVSLADFQGKPLVLSLVYTSCYHICPMTSRYLAEVVAKARDALGEDSFAVATLGFDVDHDNPQAMRHFAKQQGIDEVTGWRLLSADRATIGPLTKELGFIYFPTPNGFDHIVQATVIDTKGRVYRQVYGQVFDTPLLVEPLKELVFGNPQPGQPFLAELVDKVRFFCTTYDPSTGAYYFDYSMFIGLIIGALIIVSGAVFVFRELRHGRSARAIDENQ